MSMIDYQQALALSQDHSCKVGADPEVFLKDKSGKYISSVGIVPGTKSNPHQLDGYDPGFTVQQDNVAIEFGIPPAMHRETFINYINSVKGGAKKQIIKGLNFSTESAVYFPQDQLMTAEANTFGCEADFNAWTKEVNPSPNAADSHLRTAGGHIHLGSLADKWQMGRWMDVFIGLPSVLMDNGELRKSRYGKAGAVRLKPYGVEYRVPSNFWIFDKKLIGWVFDSTQVAHHLAYTGSHIIDPLDAKDIQKAINTNDKALAKELCDYFGALVL